ncbi:MAG: sodium:solute symporter, partial [Ignavibacteriae bacterium]
MTILDWIVFAITLLGIILYGVWRGRGQHDADAYILAGRSMPWYMVLLGVMATQASAITFLSAPGQAFTDGMRFVQYYFGLPIAMVVIAVTFIPIFRKQNVYTAYEYLEKRFDRKTRLITSMLFLLSRGLSTGISIYAPSIIVSSILGWNIYLTNVLVGGLLLLYTLRGGARSIAYTQTVMFGIILSAMLVAAYLLVDHLPNGMSFGDALTLADLSGRLNIITTNFDLHDKYNLWSGIIGGFFLALSYFGTDQSQVGRFLTGKNVKESRIGLLV